MAHNAIRSRTGQRIFIRILYERCPTNSPFLQIVDQAVWFRFTLYFRHSCVFPHLAFQNSRRGPSPLIWCTDVDHLSENSTWWPSSPSHLRLAARLGGVSNVKSTRCAGSPRRHGSAPRHARRRVPCMQAQHMHICVPSGDGSQLRRQWESA